MSWNVKIKSNLLFELSNKVIGRIIFGRLYNVVYLDILQST